MRVTDPGKFMPEIVGTDGEFTADEISFQLRNIIVQEFSRMIAGSGIPVLDMAANTQQFGKMVAKAISPTVAQYGLTIPNSTSKTSACPTKLKRCSTSAPRWASSAIWTALANMPRPRRC
jgi:membrane protease subunit (stomatin/prohibitin family)